MKGLLYRILLFYYMTIKADVETIDLGSRVPAKILANAFILLLFLCLVI